MSPTALKGLAAGRRLIRYGDLMKTVLSKSQGLFSKRTEDRLINNATHWFAWTRNTGRVFLALKYLSKCGVMKEFHDSKTSELYCSPGNQTNDSLPTVFVDRNL